MGPLDRGLCNLQAVSCADGRITVFPPFCALPLRPCLAHAGIVSLLTLCVGDGVADLVGRPYGRTRWPWSAKTLVGSAAFVVGALLANFTFVALFVRLGYFAHVPWVSRRLQLADSPGGGDRVVVAALLPTSDGSLARPDGCICYSQLIFSLLTRFHCLQSVFEWQLPVAVLFAALVESLPLGNWDNVAVFAAVVAVGRYFEW